MARARARVCVCRSRDGDEGDLGRELELGEGPHRHLRDHGAVTASRYGPARSRRGYLRGHRDLRGRAAEIVPRPLVSVPALALFRVKRLPPDARAAASQGAVTAVTQCPRYMALLRLCRGGALRHGRGHGEVTAHALVRVGTQYRGHGRTAATLRSVTALAPVSDGGGGGKKR